MESVQVNTERDQGFLREHGRHDGACDATCALFLVLLEDRQAAARDPERAAADLANRGVGAFDEAIARANSAAAPGAGPPDLWRKASDSLRRSGVHVRLMLALVALWALLASVASTAATDALGEAQDGAGGDNASPDVGGPPGRARAPRPQRVSLACRVSSSRGESSHGHPRAPLMAG